MSIVLLTTITKFDLTVFIWPDIDLPGKDI